jgi:hypothetical protein
MKEKRIRCREQQDEEYRLPSSRDSLPQRLRRIRRRRRRRKRRATGGGPLLRGGVPRPRHHGPWGAAAEHAHAMGAGVPAARRSVEEAARAAGAPASTEAATMGATAVPPEPSRKRKRGFSTLR